jgi:hypothetical protein
MADTLVKTGLLKIGDRAFRVRYFEGRTRTGRPRYSAEIVLGPEDRVILDADSLARLEARTRRLVPATLLSRRLVARRSAA